MATFPMKQTTGVMSRGTMNSSQRQELLTQSGTVPKKGYWFPDEDQKLIQLYQADEGNVDWSTIASKFENRTAKQCRERWNEYLSPSIDHSPFTVEEDFIILRSQARLGNKWKEITDLLPIRDPRKKRTPTSVKVQWHCLERKIRRSGPSYLGNQWNVGEFDPTRIPLQWNPASPQPPAPTFYAPAVPPTPQSVPPSSFYPPPQLHSHTQMPNLPSVGSISTSTATFDSSNYLLHQNTTPSSILGPRTFGQFEDDEIEVDPSNPTPPFRYAVEKNNEEVKDGRSLDHQSQSAQSSSGSSLKHSSQTPTTNPDIEKSAFRSYPTTDTAGQIFDHLQTSNQMFFPQIPYAHQPPPPPAPPSITCPPLYVTAQLPHLISHPGADYSIFSSTGPFGPFSPCQFLSMFDHHPQQRQPHFSPYSSVLESNKVDNYYVFADSRSSSCSPQDLGDSNSITALSSEENRPLEF